MTVLLEARDLTRRFGSEASSGTLVLRGVSMTIEAGDSLAIVGPSGAGKSTLLNLIGGLDTPTSGQILFDGTDIAQKGPDELADFRNREVGFVFQSHHLLPQCSALENVLVPTLVRSPAERANAEERARKLLERVGLAGRVTHRPGQLSGGECQRVAVVRALINEPRLLLADEPTGSLDSESSNELSELLLELNREEGVALVVVTHSDKLAERMERVLRIVDGVLDTTARSLHHG